MISSAELSSSVSKQNIDNALSNTTLNDDNYLADEFYDVTSSNYYDFYISPRTVKFYNKYYLNYNTDATEWDESTTIYLHFNISTTTRPTDTTLVDSWIKSNFSDYLVTSTEPDTSVENYELTGLAIAQKDATKFESNILTNIIQELGTFKDALSARNLKEHNEVKTVIINQTTTLDLYPSKYENYYLGSEANITDFNAPTYSHTTSYEGYYITKPIPIDLEQCDYMIGASRHMGLFDENGKSLYNSQTQQAALTLNKEYCEDKDIDYTQVKYIVTSNRDSAKVNFFVKYIETKHYYTYNLPYLSLTEDQLSNIKPTNKVTLSNVDRIVSIGDSYTESHYTIKDKAWMSKVSELSDYNMDNFAISGDTYRGQLNKIRTGSYAYASSSGMTWESLHPTHTILISKTNDTKYMTNEQFVYDMIACLETTKQLGAIPIICSEYHTASADMALSAYYEYAQKYGGYYIDLVEKDYKLRGSDYAAFWGGSHPGTRSNHLMCDPICNYINKYMPRPYSSIKIFRARDNSLTDDLDNYLFGNIEERAEKFKEISICHSALNESKYYDNCTNKPNHKVESEYFKLMAGIAIPFEKVALIDVILPSTVHDISEVKLNTNTLSNVTCYVKDCLAEPYPSPDFCRRFDIPQVLTIGTDVAVGNIYTSNKSTGVNYTVVEILFDQVESDNGFVDGTILICKGNRTTSAYNDSTITKTSGTGLDTLSCSYESIGLSSDYPKGKADIGHYIALEKYGVVEGTVLKRAVDYDKITFLLVGTDTFSLTSVDVEFVGNITKQRDVPRYKLITETSQTNGEQNELLAQNFGSSYTLTTPADGVLPKGVTSIFTLTTENKFFKNYTLNHRSNLLKSDKYKVKVWCRYFPDIFDETTMTYPDDSTITDDSFDYAKLKISCATDSNGKTKIPFTRLVGLHWTEVETEIYLPDNNLTLYLTLTTDEKPIQIAKVILEDCT